MKINGKRLASKRYSSGEMKLMHEEMMRGVTGNKVHVFYDGSGFDFFELLLVLRYYVAKGLDVSLTLAYLPYQRMDHNSSTHVQTCLLVFETLNALGLKQIEVCEPHCELDGLHFGVKRSLVKPLLCKVMASIGFDSEKDVLLFTDKGALKRYAPFAKHFVHCQKVRDPQTGWIVSYELVGKVPNGAKVIVVDDIISTGDTLMHAVEAVAPFLSEPLHIVCGHFEKNTFNKRLLNSEKVSCIWASNSLTKRQSAKLKLVAVETLLREGEKHETD